VSSKHPPLSHKVRRTEDYGYDDSQDTPPGRINLKNVVRMIMTHYKDDNCKIEDLATTYKLKAEDVGMYFFPLNKLMFI